MMVLVCLLIIVTVYTVNSDNNIALHKPAFQSSDFNDKWTAEKALDGGLGSVMTDDSCTHTGCSGEPCDLKTGLGIFASVKRRLSWQRLSQAYFWYDTDY